MPEKSEKQKKNDDATAILEVFEKLEVGPVKIEPKRLIAPYRLFYQGKEESIDLIYHYEEEVFKVSHSASD